MGLNSQDVYFRLEPSFQRIERKLDRLLGLLEPGKEQEKECSKSPDGKHHWGVPRGVLDYVQGVLTCNYCGDATMQTGFR